MLPVTVLQFFVAGASAAALTIQIENPFDVIFGNGGRPWKHHHPDYPRPHPNPGRTIYETITGDGRFSCLTKAIDYVGDEIVDVLNDAGNPITFFAVPDNALHRGCHKGDEDYEFDVTAPGPDHRQLISTVLSGSPFNEEDLVATFGSPSPDLSTVISAIDTVDDLEDKGGDDDGDDGDDDDDDEKKRRKKVIRFIINAVLRYHVLPYASPIDGLRENHTYPTHLHIPVALGGHNQRLRVEHVYKKHKVKTILNHFTKVVVPDVQASNGYIHVVDHPIIPPASAFAELFAMAHHFSTFTSALQRSGLGDEVDLRYIWDKEKGEGHFEGSAAVTVFAPPESAWHRLPKRLRMFLFSPFGTSALRKLLEYHIVPGAIVHSDYFHNQTAETNPDVGQACTCGEHAMLKKKKHGHPHRTPISSVDLDLDTRYFNHTVHWMVEKSELTYPHHRRPDEYRTDVFVNGREVEIADIIAVNGAIHVIDRIMCPWQYDEPGDYEVDGRHGRGGHRHRYPHHRHGGHHHHRHRGGHHDHDHDHDDDGHRHHDDLEHGEWDEGEDLVWQGWEDRLPQWVAGC